MKIEKMILSAGRTGFYFDDQKAIKAGAQTDGAAYIGAPVTPGFDRIRQPGEAISIQFLLSDGQIAWGDCAAVQYSGAGGRDPLFLAREFMPILKSIAVPFFEGKEITTFRAMADEADQLRVNGKPLHTALRYGLSQALLSAVALSNHELMCETVAREYDTTVSSKMIPIFTQSGDARYDNADKMIIKGAEVLPHALINNVHEKLGNQGEILLSYLKWLKERITQLRFAESYHPTVHIDVYGTIGQAFGIENYDAMCDYLAKLVDAVSPFPLRVEGPVDAEGRDAQIEHLAKLTAAVDRRSIPVELVADEWCNTFEDIRDFADARAGHMIQIKTPDLGGIQHTVEAVLYCQKKGIGAYQGGTCNETERSAQICVHTAMAAQPVQILAKPGMGVDEAYMIAFNEMQRILSFRMVGRKG